MNHDIATRETILSALIETAPEVVAGDIDDSMPLREQVDLDSMDWLTFLQRIHRLFQIEIPEGDYRQLRSLHDITDYVHQRVSVGSGPAQAPA